MLACFPCLANQLSDGHQMLEFLMVDRVLPAALGHQQRNWNDGVLHIGLRAWLFLSGGLVRSLVLYLHNPA